MHLVVDGYNGDREKMKDPEFVRRFLDEYPGRIGMTKIMGPHVMVYDAPKHEDWGVSGFVIIAESHISVHTFPERAYINIDVFSCKEFDAQRALDELRATFSLGDVRSWTLERGLEYASLEAAAVTVDRERRQLRF